MKTYQIDYKNEQHEIEAESYEAAAIQFARSLGCDTARRSTGDPEMSGVFNGYDRVGDAISCVTANFHLRQTND